MRPKVTAAFVLAAAVIGVLSTLGVAGAASGGAKVGLRESTVGRILVGSNGHTLYLFVPDKRSKSTCYGACAAAWPPLLTTGKPVARPGVNALLLGTVKRKDGKLQVTYNRHPLYYFASDKKAGQTTGQGASNVWYVLSASGKKVSSAPAPASPPPAPAPPPASEPTPPSPADPGYGYGS
jgi:predicted lipoprotein with Yx(FWY)xxD motif